MKIQILGAGCPKCTKLAESVDDVARELGLDYELTKITDLNEIIRFGGVMPPGLAIDGQLKLTGRVPSKDEIRAILTA